MKAFLSLCAMAVVAIATEHDARQAPAAPAVLTATKVFHTVIEQSPFFVEGTSTVVWTQSPSVTDSQPPPTAIPSNVPASIAVSVPANLSAILSA
ncbi:hypothetical protein D9756_002104 [Leucocoprinus leucothites]|uniref:Uncharacterized protein n=1 Tax=Leucocoprinus leucothites TaxID=201217 RepID=A0A8H5LLN0_9AGAR|nr:hypothetical protein D9756_002104 [Leucoagaricus leucothites]